MQNVTRRHVASQEAGQAGISCAKRSSDVSSRLSGCIHLTVHEHAGGQLGIPLRQNTCDTTLHYLYNIVQSRVSCQTKRQCSQMPASHVTSKQQAAAKGHVPFNAHRFICSHDSYTASHSLICVAALLLLPSFPMLRTCRHVIEC